MARESRGGQLPPLDLPARGPPATRSLPSLLCAAQDTVTVECLRVYKIDIKHGLIFVEGAVPGKPGTIIRVRDSPKRPFDTASPPPFPTYTLSPEDRERASKWASGEFLSLEEELKMRLAGAPIPSGAVTEPPYELLAPPPTVDPFAVREDDEGEPS